MLDELRLAAQPVLVVMEDVHWADEATLDLIKFLGRRIERTHEAADWSRKSIALARAFGDRRRLCFSLATLGMALLFIASARPDDA